VTTLDRDMLRRLCRARALLCAQRERPPTVRAVAEAVAISPFHFIRRFEQVFGWTPSQFRIHARLERAKELLERGELSVTETCLAVGFASPASFSALFRARVGVPPSEFRRRALVSVLLPRLFVPGCLGLMGRVPDAGLFRNSR
jgi:AraC-like DNA-binding protein